MLIILLILIFDFIPVIVQSYQLKFFGFTIMMISLFICQVMDFWLFVVVAGLYLRYMSSKLTHPY